MSSNFIFRRGDLLGVKDREYVYGYVIAQVIRYNRFFYCKDVLTGEFHFIVFDPEFHFIMCPAFDPDIKPDIDVISMGAEFYDALDRLFDFSSEEESSADW
jgi:hypothetical protein|tara:strand:- start:284 stop:586 length:303 start_codon:yes stop_codon:yes gene_type:complete